MLKESIIFSGFSGPGVKGIFLLGCLLSSILRASLVAAQPQPGLEEYPYSKGHHKIFYFDTGDEYLLSTIPELIEALDTMEAGVERAKGNLKSLTETFTACQDCKVMENL